MVAIEAALAGHQVTATDLYPDVLDLAAWNAALHGVELELLAGHLFAPVAGRQFDLAMIAPHYGGAADMLRVETLRDGPTVLAPGGTLVVATFLESEGDHVGLVDLLTPMAQAGAQVSVRPYHATQKERWFTRPDPAVAGMVGRARYLIEIGRPRSDAGAGSATTVTTAAEDALTTALGGWAFIMVVNSIGGLTVGRGSMAPRPTPSTPTLPPRPLPTRPRRPPRPTPSTPTRPRRPAPSTPTPPPRPAPSTPTPPPQLLRSSPTSPTSPTAHLAHPADPREAIIPLAHLVDPAARHAVRPTLDADVTGHPNRRPAATVTTADDVAALTRILADCAAGVVDLTTPIPFVLHDACRLGDRPCVDAHAALVDARGGIRP